MEGRGCNLIDCLKLTDYFSQGYHMSMMSLFNNDDSNLYFDDILFTPRGGISLLYLFSSLSLFLRICSPLYASGVSSFFFDNLRNKEEYV